MSNPFSKRDSAAVDADLGTSSSTALTHRQRSNSLRAVENITRQAENARNTTAPQTLLGKVLDYIAPSEVRREIKRGDAELVRVETKAAIAIYQSIKDSETRQIGAISEGYAMAAEMQVAKEIGNRAAQVFADVDEIVVQSGDEFDRSIEHSVETANGYGTASARESAAERIVRRKAARAELEESVMDNVLQAIRRKQK